MKEDGLPIPEPLAPDLSEKAFGMPIPDSVAPGLFVEVTIENPVVVTVLTSDHSVELVSV